MGQKIHEHENTAFEVVSPALFCTKTPSIMFQFHPWTPAHYFNWINEEIWLQSFLFFLCLSFLAGKSTKIEALPLVCHRNHRNQFGSRKENIRKRRELTTGSPQLFLPCFATSKMKKNLKICWLDKNRPMDVCFTLLNGV